MHEEIFCDACGKILEIKEEKGKEIGVCSCGFEKEIPYPLNFSEKIEIKNVGEGIATEEKTKGFPHTCKKCGYDKCDVQELGSSYSDEADKFLFTCKKCGYVEKQHDGTGN